VVNVSSGAQRMSDILWDDPHFTRTGYEPLVAYAQSKTANVLFAVELDRRWAKDAIRGYALHPGIVAGTPLNSAADPEALRDMGLVDDQGDPIIAPEAGKKTPPQGASTIAFAAASPLLEGIGGVYLRDNDISPLDEDTSPLDLTAEVVPCDVAPHSVDPFSAQRLWKLSEEMLKG
jgi:NAD(P)-dependent dehydrogenase (short-subunit alcohol dehydrogenase family)